MDQHTRKLYVDQHTWDRVTNTKRDIRELKMALASITMAAIAITSQCPLAVVSRAGKDFCSHLEVKFSVNWFRQLKRLHNTIQRGRFLM